MFAADLRISKVSEAQSKKLFFAATLLCFLYVDLTRNLKPNFKAQIVSTMTQSLWVWLIIWVSEETDFCFQLMELKTKGPDII